MQSKATTVAQYLAELPPDRKAAIAEVRRTILANTDRDLEENMMYGMITYVVPHRVYPPGYHCSPDQPLPYAALASQKQHMSLYVMGHSYDPKEEARLRDGFAKAGKKLDMGKCCIRFKKLEDLPLSVVGEMFRRMPSKRYVELYERALGSRAGGAPKSGSGSRAPRGSKKAPAKARAAPKRRPAAPAKKKPARAGAARRATGR